MKGVITTEQLLDMLENGDVGSFSISEMPVVDDISAFLVKQKLTPGENTVHPDILYTIYKKTTEFPYGKKKFLRLVNVYLDKNEQGKYLVNRKINELLFAYCINRQEHPTRAFSNKKYKSIKKFQAQSGLNVGNFWVYGGYIYMWYKRHNRVCDEKYFDKIMKLLFKKRLHKNEWYYQINYKEIHFLSQDEIERTNQGRCKEWHEQQKRKRNPVEVKIPSQP